MKIDALSIDEFFEASKEHKETLIALDKLIREMAPNLDRKLYNSDTICSIGYAEIPYSTVREPNGRYPMLAIAPQKHTANLYVMAVMDGMSLVERYKGKLGKVSTGKSCIRIKKMKDLDVEAL